MPMSAIDLSQMETVTPLSRDKLINVARSGTPFFFNHLPSPHQFMRDNVRLFNPAGSIQPNIQSIQVWPRPGGDPPKVKNIETFLPHAAASIAITNAAKSLFSSPLKTTMLTALASGALFNRRFTC